MNKNNIEKIFKRFIKKRIGYSLSLLILFLITGGISLSTETITNLELEKEKIKKEISENEKIIKKYDIELVDLIKKGDFYSKPLFNSTQIFFSYQNLSTGKMKDNTDKEFAETIDAVNKHYGENILNSGKDLGKDKVIAGNGVVVDTTTFKEEIEIGANIKPVEPQFSPINSNISVNVSAPVINLGALPKSLTPAIPVISATTAPVINIPLLSSGINISIVPTEAIDKIDITAPAITIPKVPTEKNVVVNPPATPNGFEPTIIAIPVPPTVPVLNIPAVTIPNISTASSGNGDGSWYWNLSGSNGTISQVIMTSGKWDISVAGNSYTDGFSSEITDYSAHFAAPYGGTPIVNQTYSGFSNSGQMGMYRIVGSPYTLFGENTEINIDASARSKSGSVRQFIHFDPHGDKSMDSIDEIIDATDAERQEVKDIQAKYKTSYLAPKHMMLSMKGIINVTGNTINVVGLQGHYGPPYANPYIIHSGKINITGNNNVVFAYTPEHQNESRDSIISNYDSGEIIINGDENFVMVYDKQTITQSHSFKNDGKIEIENGNKNVGVYIKRSAKGGTLDLIKPIIITNGNENIGIVHKNETYNQLNPQSVIKVDIKNGNKNIGLLEEMTQKYTSHEFNISGGTDGMAVISTNGVLSIGSGNISITGGNKNIGLITIGGNIISDGNIFMINGSENIAALAKDGNSISVAGNVSIGSSSPVTNSIPFYVTDTNSKIALSDDKLSINLSGDSIGVYSSDNGSFTANRTSLIHSGIGFGNGILEPTAPVNIYVEGTTISEVDKGIGLFANAGGKINTKNTYVKVKNGSVGIASMGTNSKIDITNGIVDYEGNGYAVYSDGNGHIDLTDGEIILRGKATAIELDLSKPNPITLTGAKIVVMSNEAIGVNLKNAGTLNIGSLESNIETALGGVKITSGTDGTQVFDKYKVTVVDGGTLNIDANMDKSDTNTASPGFFYYRRFLGQRLNLNVLNNIEVKSEIDSINAASYFKGQVVGLEMNSSKSAGSLTDTQINLGTGSKITADRTDTGDGAIGLYINFGKINLAANSKVEVETGNNIVNDKGIGVYAVNGSMVSNAGNIKVQGNQAIGILGMAYREDALNNAVVNEFGTGGIFANQGKLDIINDGDIILDGTGTIGIYAYNNNINGANTDAKVVNMPTGNIKVGNSNNLNAAVGIYGEKATISNQGKITVGDGGIAIYAKNDSNIIDLGSLNIGSDGIGVMLDGKSDISAASLTLTGTGIDINGKTGIFYRGTGNESKNVSIDINASNFEKGTAVYAENMNILSSGTLNIGKDGVGLLLKGTSVNIGTNAGIIDLTADKTGAVGMYTKTANLLNSGTINVNSFSQIGVYAEGIGNKAINEGAIHLNADGVTGIFVKDNAVGELNTGNIISFSGKSSVGIFSEKAAVKLKTNLNFINKNENKNIYVYGKDAVVEIDNGKNVIVDGVTAPMTAGNKTVGIYLENTGTGSIFNGNGNLEVKNEAIGVYSKGNNSLNINITADGEKTTGVFIDGGSSVSGTVTVKGTGTVGAIGIYGDNGKITINSPGLTLNTDTNKGTGIYLTNGAYIEGNDITINNTAGIKNIGVYYNKGISEKTLTNKAAIKLIGSDSIGIYAAGGVKLINTKNIESTAAGTSNNIASYIQGNSSLISNGNITMNSLNNIGMYVEEGEGINNGVLDVSGATGTSSAGMAAKNNTLGNKSFIKNTGTIKSGNNLGMYIAGTGINSGINTGNITATTGTGVYVDGLENSFNGTEGTITSNAIGIYLKNTGSNKITAGTLNIASGGVGVFADNAKIDFSVNAADSAGIVGVAAKNNSVISGNIKTGQDSVGVYLLDDTVTFNNANITTGTNNLGTSVGILFDSGITGNYTMNNATVNAKNGIGIYLNGTGMSLSHNGTINIEDGIGMYVKNGTTLTTETSILNINKGTGIYVDGGIVNFGTTGNLTINFLDGGGIGVFNNGGNLTLGNNITVTGSGALVATATTNGSLNSTGNLNIGTGAIGLLGQYDNGVNGNKNISNSGNITAKDGGIGLAAVIGDSLPLHTITLNNTGIITANGESPAHNPSIAMYTDVADIVNTGNIKVGNNSIGIYSNYNGILTSIQNDNMTLTGTDGIGVYIKGSTNGLISNNITSTEAKNTGIVLEGISSNINAGNIALGNESIGIFAMNGTVSTINSSISVGDSSSSKNAIGIVANGGSNINLTGTSTISAGDKGIGVYAEGIGTIAVVTNTNNISVGTDGIYIYSKGAALTFTGNITADNQIGVVADGGTLNSSTFSITAKNGGIGVFLKNTVPTFGSSTIAVQAGNSSKYSIGIYYDNVPVIGTAPVITQTGSYTIGMVLNNSTGTSAGGIFIGNSGNNQIGTIVRENSNFTAAGDVKVAGDKNIGIYSEKSQILVNGDLAVLDSSSSADKSISSLGISLNGGSYRGIGNISIGNNSIGIFAKSMITGNLISQGTGIENMNVGNNGLGIYGEGSGDVIANMSNITIGSSNATGVYTKGMNSTVKGNMSIGANTSIGIVSEGSGNVSYTGSMAIENKIASGSVGIYKLLGAGTISTSTGSWSVGNNGYGIYIQQAKTENINEKEIITITSNSATVNNNADMILGTSAVGIFSNGNNIINNAGNIAVGATDIKNNNHTDSDQHLNSIGIYAANGTKINNTGNITVNHDHSIGVYAQGEKTNFINTGVINVDNGGIGVLVRNGATAVNAAGGNIILGNNIASCKTATVGMAAYGGARIENAGTITVNEGVGMLLGVGATFSNTGNIFVKNGIGIEGPGTLTNSGNITILPGGMGSATALTGLATAQVGSVIIKPDGTILINDKYTSIGGTLSTAGNIVVNGAYVDVTTGTPLFNANSVSGEVKLLPNFAATGNGISYEIEGFVNTATGTITGSKLTPVTSPLFVAKVTDKGNLVIAKRPYADLTVGNQFDALDKGLDNILKNSGGNGKDAEILKGLNQYLEGLPADQFEREASRKLAETRGDIYATIQGRMQDINQAFANSFYELESSYNLTKDSSKYSVIYTDGNYKDSTVGIDDYDYKVMGLLYMKEKEGTEYGSKYGYTIGFAGSKFDFDDGGSKEDVYSLRVGAHRVKNLSDEHKVSWLSRIELGYNRHIAKRKLNLQETFENKGEYNTYSVALDNRLTKAIYTDLSRQLDVYADLDLEYGKVDDFKEHAGSKGGLEVQIKDNDYLSAQAAAGVKAQQRIYVVNDVSVKVTADVKYAYELGDNYDGNKARLKNGGEGYYSLITPDEKEGKLSGKVGLTVEKANHMGVTFEVEAADESNRKDSSVKYGVRFNYKF